MSQEKKKNKHIGTNVTEERLKTLSARAEVALMTITNHIVSHFTLSFHRADFTSRRFAAASSKQIVAQSGPTAMTPSTQFMSPLILVMVSDVPSTVFWHWYSCVTLWSSSLQTPFHTHMFYLTQHSHLVAGQNKWCWHSCQMFSLQKRNSIY